MHLFAFVGVSAFGLWRLNVVVKQTDAQAPKTAARLEKLWRMALMAMRESKYIPAEKALLTILKIDHRNAPAYNRLGILYAKQHNFEDAIGCFEIASSIDRKPSSLHNLGLIYYETAQYDKAAAAFQKALDQEPLAVRYIALAKSQQKQNNNEGMISSLESAVELEPNPQTYQLLIDAYNQNGDTRKAHALNEKLKALIVKHHDDHVRQPRRVS